MKNPHDSTWQLLLGACCLLALAAQPQRAAASQAAGWWGGEWKCNIDGRPARMSWKVVDAPQTSCDGDVCSTAASVRWVGRFSDNGSRWVGLRDARNSSMNGLYFRHADGNQWYLSAPAQGKTTGWTTWNSKKYKLVCWR